MWLRIMYNKGVVLVLKMSFSTAAVSESKEGQLNVAFGGEMII